LRRLECVEVAQVMCRRRLEELIHNGNNVVFNAFLYPKPVQRFENMVRIGGPESCNNSMSKSILDILKQWQHQNFHLGVTAQGSGEWKSPSVVQEHGAKSC